jgi:hypothetical protein
VRYKIYVSRFILILFTTTTMALMPVATRNRVNPMSISNIEQSVVPYGTYGHVGPCNDPYCLICRPQRHDRHRKHHHHKQHHHHHHHKKHKHFWDDFLARGESASSTVTVHSIELDERRPYYDRALVPVNQAEKQVVSTTRTERIANDDYVREAWVSHCSFFFIKLICFL